MITLGTLKEMKQPKSQVERRVLPKIKDMLQWGVVSAGDILVAKGFEEAGEAVLLANGHVRFNGEEISMQYWLRNMTGWKSVETYKFAVHKVSGKSLSEIRKEYMEQNME